MNWKKLNSFRIIAKYESLNKAAKATEKSQSSLTRSVKSLEKSCGQIHPKGITLTKEGIQLLKIVSEFNDDLASFSSSRVGEVIKGIK